jgi:hypothetical protein
VPCGSGAVGSLNQDRHPARSLANRSRPTRTASRQALAVAAVGHGAKPPPRAARWHGVFTTHRELDHDHGDGAPGDWELPVAVLRGRLDPHERGPGHPRPTTTRPTGEAASIGGIWARFARGPRWRPWASAALWRVMTLRSPTGVNMAARPARSPDSLSRSWRPRTVRPLDHESQPWPPTKVVVRSIPDKTEKGPEVLAWGCSSAGRAPAPDQQRPPPHG